MKVPFSVEMRNEMVSSSGEVARWVMILSASPSAVVCSRSFLLLVLSTFASLEETRIG